MPKAKYETIYLQIRKDITSGKYQFGDYLPSENEYAERFDCTRNTVRRALSILTGEGYLQPRHGRGVRFAQFICAGQVDIPVAVG